MLISHLFILIVEVGAVAIEKRRRAPKGHVEAEPRAVGAQNAASGTTASTLSDIEQFLLAILTGSGSSGGTTNSDPHIVEEVSAEPVIRVPSSTPTIAVPMASISAAGTEPTSSIQPPSPTLANGTVTSNTMASPDVEVTPAPSLDPGEEECTPFTRCVDLALSCGPSHYLRYGGYENEYDANVLERLR